MRAERRLLRIGEYLIARACRRLPTEARDERYQEWIAELPVILRDPDVRPAPRRAARMLRYASGTIRGTVLTGGGARRLLGYVAEQAVLLIILGLVNYFEGWAKTPPALAVMGSYWLAGSLIGSGIRLAYRRLRGKEPGDTLENAMQARMQARELAQTQAEKARAQARATSILRARASAGLVTSTAGDTAALGFPYRRLGAGYRAAEVDELIARIEATLSGNARPGQAVTAADVQTAEFHVTLHGGYEQLTIDEALDHYARELGERTPPPMSDRD